MFSIWINNRLHASSLGPAEALAEARAMRHLPEFAHVRPSIYAEDGTPTSLSDLASMVSYR